MKKLSEDYSPLINTVVLGAVSAGIAFVLFYFLESFAKIENTTYSVGGAVAGFGVVFYLLSRHMKETASTEDQDRIKELEEHLATKRLKVNLEFPDPSESIELDTVKCRYHLKVGAQEEEGELEVGLTVGGWQCILPPDCEEKRVRLTLVETDGQAWEVPTQWPTVNMKAVKR